MSKPVVSMRLTPKQQGALFIRKCELDDELAALIIKSEKIEAALIKIRDKDISVTPRAWVKYARWIAREALDDI